ncbi:hypothetical protein, partial [uncultured Alistipes sp.]|uniref:hypothetical protein n=1 Tax=uncultured Alistipes sp. TaxID=538949 RepID=UPI0026088C09
DPNLGKVVLYQLSYFRSTMMNLSRTKCFCFSVSVRVAISFLTLQIYGEKSFLQIFSGVFLLFGRLFFRSKVGLFCNLFIMLYLYVRVKFGIFVRETGVPSERSSFFVRCAADRRSAEASDGRLRRTGKSDAASDFFEGGIDREFFRSPETEIPTLSP